MLGRKTYSRAELDRARTVVDEHLAVYRELRVAAGTDAKAAEALAAYEPVANNRMVLVLDRMFVHRIRPVVGKDTNPLTEVELLAESLLVGEVLRTNKVIKYEPVKSVLGLVDGDPIALDVDQFERLAVAFLAEIEARFAEA